MNDVYSEENNEIKVTCNEEGLDDSGFSRHEQIEREQIERGSLNEQWLRMYQHVGQSMDPFGNVPMYRVGSDGYAHTGDPTDQLEFEQIPRNQRMFHDGVPAADDPAAADPAADDPLDLRRTPVWQWRHWWRTLAVCQWLGCVSI